MPFTSDKQASDCIDRTIPSRYPLSSMRIGEPVAAGVRETRH
jgi:hypothetical protein